MRRDLNLLKNVSPYPVKENPWDKIKRRFEFLKNVSPYPVKENPWDKIKRRVKVVSFHPQSVQKIAALKIAFSKPSLFFHIIHFIIIFFGWN